MGVGKTDFGYKVHQWPLQEKLHFPPVLNCWERLEILFFPALNPSPATPHILGIRVLWLFAQLKSLPHNKNLLFLLLYSTMGGGLAN